MGAVTQPWQANVVFRGLSPEEFKAFDEPGYVKIAWTLRVEPIGASESIFRTETRVVTTDRTARSRFRWYWARFSPGIVLIRQVMLTQVRRDAERLALVPAPPRPGVTWLRPAVHAGRRSSSSLPSTTGHCGRSWRPSGWR